MILIKIDTLSLKEILCLISFTLETSLIITTNREWIDRRVKVGTVLKFFSGRETTWKLEMKREGGRNVETGSIDLKRACFYVLLNVARVLDWQQIVSFSQDQIFHFLPLFTLLCFPSVDAWCSFVTSSLCSSFIFNWHDHQNSLYGYQYSPFIITT